MHIGQYNVGQYNIAYCCLHFWLLLFAYLGLYSIVVVYL